jgi:hypothetical protein
VSGFGNSFDRSRPISSTTVTTAGLISPAGVLLVEVMEDLGIVIQDCGPI